VIQTDSTNKLVGYIKLLKPTGCLTQQQVLTFNISTFCPHSVFMCFVYGSQNKQRLLLFTALTDEFYNRDGKCLLRGTYWVFIQRITSCPQCDKDDRELGKVATPWLITQDTD
jgi:hypothetical protein